MGMASCADTHEHEIRLRLRLLPDPRPCTRRQRAGGVGGQRGGWARARAVARQSETEERRVRVARFHARLGALWHLRSRRMHHHQDVMGLAVACARTERWSVGATTRARAPCEQPRTRTRAAPAPLALRRSRRSLHRRSCSAARAVSGAATGRVSEPRPWRARTAGARGRAVPTCNRAARSDGTRAPRSPARGAAAAAWCVRTGFAIKAAVAVVAVTSASSAQAAASRSGFISRNSS